MSREADLAFLRRAIAVAERARAKGNHPFGAVLVDADGNVLAEGENNFTIDRGPGHAETNLARQAAREFPPELLATATLYTSVEPCCMCAGTIYWANIGTVVFGMTERVRCARRDDQDLSDSIAKYTDRGSRRAVADAHLTPRRLGGRGEGRSPACRPGSRRSGGTGRSPRRSPRSPSRRSRRAAPSIR